MAQDTTLKETLNDLYDTLADMSASELGVLATQWAFLKAYAEQSNAQRTLLYAKLIDIAKQSPTLTKHGFPNVFHSPRFADEPAPNHNQPASTQGIPPVHNEIIRIAERINELLAQSKPKA